MEDDCSELCAEWEETLNQSKALVRAAWRLCGAECEVAAQASLFELLAATHAHARVVAKRMRAATRGVKGGVIVRRRGQCGHFSATAVNDSRLLRWKVCAAHRWCVADIACNTLRKCWPRSTKGCRRPCWVPLRTASTTQSLPSSKCQATPPQGGGTHKWLLCGRSACEKRCPRAATAICERHRCHLFIIARARWPAPARGKGFGTRGHRPVEQ